MKKIKILSKFITILSTFVLTCSSFSAMESKNPNNAQVNINQNDELSNLKNKLAKFTCIDWAFRGNPYDFEYKIKIEYNNNEMEKFEKLLDECHNEINSLIFAMEKPEKKVLSIEKKLLKENDLLIKKDLLEEKDLLIEEQKKQHKLMIDKLEKRNKLYFDFAVFELESLFIEIEKIENFAKENQITNDNKNEHNNFNQLKEILQDLYDEICTMMELPLEKVSVDDLKNIARKIRGCYEKIYILYKKSGFNKLYEKIKLDKELYEKFKLYQPDKLKNLHNKLLLGNPLKNNYKKNLNFNVKEDSKKDSKVNNANMKKDLSIDDKIKILLPRINNKENNILELLQNLKNDPSKNNDKNFKELERQYNKNSNDYKKSCEEYRNISKKNDKNELPRIYNDLKNTYNSDKALRENIQKLIWSNNINSDNKIEKDSKTNNNINDNIKNDDNDFSIFDNNNVKEKKFKPNDNTIVFEGKEKADLKVNDADEDINEILDLSKKIDIKNNNTKSLLEKITNFVNTTKNFNQPIKKSDLNDIKIKLNKIDKSYEELNNTLKNLENIQKHVQNNYINSDNKIKKGSITNNDNDDFSIPNNNNVTIIFEGEEKADLNVNKNIRSIEKKIDDLISEIVTQDINISNLLKKIDYFKSKNPSKNINNKVFNELKENYEKLHEEMESMKCIFQEFQSLNTSEINLQLKKDQYKNYKNLKNKLIKIKKSYDSLYSNIKSITPNEEEKGSIANNDDIFKDDVKEDLNKYSNSIKEELLKLVKETENKIKKLINQTNNIMKIDNDPDYAQLIKENIEEFEMNLEINKKDIIETKNMSEKKYNKVKEKLKNIDKCLDIYADNYSKLEKDNKISYLNENKKNLNIDATEKQIDEKKKESEKNIINLPNDDLNEQQKKLENAKEKTNSNLDIINQLKIETKDLLSDAKSFSDKISDHKNEIPIVGKIRELLKKLQDFNSKNKNTLKKSRNVFEKQFNELKNNYEQTKRDFYAEKYKLSENKKEEDEKKTQNSNNIIKIKDILNILNKKQINEMKTQSEKNIINNKPNSEINKLEIDIANSYFDFYSFIKHIAKFIDNLSENSLNNFYDNVSTKLDDLKKDIKNYKEQNSKNEKTIKKLQNQLDKIKKSFNIESSFIEIENLISQIKLDKNILNKDILFMKNISWVKFRDLIYDVKKYQKNDSNLDNMLINLYRLINIKTRMCTIYKNFDTLKRLNLEEPNLSDYEISVSSRYNEILPKLEDYYNIIYRKFEEYKQTHPLPKDDSNKKQTNEIETLMNNITTFITENKEKLNSNQLEALKDIFLSLKELKLTKKYENFLQNDMNAEFIKNDMKEVLRNEHYEINRKTNERIYLFKKYSQDFKEIQDNFTNNNLNKQKKLTTEELIKEVKDIFKKPNENQINEIKKEEDEKTQDSNISEIDKLEKEIKDLSLSVISFVSNHTIKSLNSKKISMESIYNLETKLKEKINALKQDIKNYKDANFKNKKTIEELKNQSDEIECILIVESSLIESEILISQIKLNKNILNKDNLSNKNVTWFKFRDLIYLVKTYQNNNAELNDMIMTLYKLCNVANNLYLIRNILNKFKPLNEKEIAEYNKYKSQINDKYNLISDQLDQYYDAILKKFKEYEIPVSLPSYNANNEPTNEIEALINEIVNFINEQAIQKKELPKEKFLQLKDLVTSLYDLNLTKKYENFLQNDIQDNSIDKDMKEVLSNEQNYIDQMADDLTETFESCSKEFDEIQNEIINNLNNENDKKKNKKKKKNKNNINDKNNSNNINRLNLLIKITEEFIVKIIPNNSNNINQAITDIEKYISKKDVLNKKDFNELMSISKELNALFDSQQNLQNQCEKSYDLIKNFKSNIINNIGAKKAEKCIDAAIFKYDNMSKEQAAINKKYDKLVNSFLVIKNKNGSSDNLKK